MEKNKRKFIIIKKNTFFFEKNINLGKKLFRWNNFN
jgi:hypothetical protein